jgi:hypothetical protein
MTHSSVWLYDPCFLQQNIETSVLTPVQTNERFETMVAVLAGLAENTGLKQFTFETNSAETNATLATAISLQRNTSITTLDLRNAGSKKMKKIENLK